MTTNVLPLTRATTGAFSQAAAAEIRAELGRQGLSQRMLGERLGHNQTWVSVRVSPKASVDLTLDEIAEIAEALNVSVQRLLVWLPRLDSNQQPSGYPLSLVSEVCWAPAWCECSKCGELAEVIDLASRRAS